MDVNEFLVKCSDMYPFNTKDSAKLLSLLDEYKSSIEGKVQTSKLTYDFDRLFERIKKTYKYKTMPTVEFILTSMDSAVKIADYSTANLGELFVLAYGKRQPDYTMCWQFKAWTKNEPGSTVKFESQQLKEHEAMYDKVVPMHFPPGTTLFTSHPCYEEPTTVVLPDRRKKEFSEDGRWEELAEL